MNNMRNKILSLLVLLLTAATGAWAQTTFGVKEITADMVPADWSVDNSKVTPKDLADMGINFVGITEAQARTWADYPTTGHVYLLHAYTTSFQSVDWNNGNPNGSSTAYTRQNIYNLIVDLDYRVFVTVEPIVTWDATTKTATFTMPGSNVVLTPIYARTAAFATTGTGSEMKMLLPAAAEGVIAGTDAPLIAEGTGVVATTTIGETPTAQGTVMYYVGTTAPTIGSADWTEDVPTAKTIADDGAELKVWYYIKGADAPKGEAATLDNTFNNTDPVSLPVTVRSNKFDLTLKAANANTIDATDVSKGSVTVAGTDKTRDITAEGKLKAVKMGSEVKLKANNGYKFRKVEVKKTQTITITNGNQFSITLDIAGCTTWDDVITKNPDKIKKVLGGYINDSTDQYGLMKGGVPVRTDQDFDPNATDYKWVPTN